MTNEQKQLALLLAKRVLWAGIKSVGRAAAILAVVTLFKGEIKDLSFEELVTGERKKVIR